MSNPFDQFAGTLQAALPPSDASAVPSVAGGAPAAPGGQPQFNIMAQPAQEKKPVMNQPNALQQNAMASQQGGMGMYGQAPPAPQFPTQSAPQIGYGGMGGNMGGGGMYGQAPPPMQQPPQQQMMAPTNSMNANFGGAYNNGWGQTPQPGASMNGALPPAPMQQLTNGAAPGAMAGALVPTGQPSNPYALGPPGAQPPAAANPFGGAIAAPAPPAQPPAPALAAGPFGAPGAMAPAPFGAPQGSQRQLGAPAPAAPAPALAADPFGAAPVAPPQPPAPALAADPWGAPPAAAPSTALVPSAAPPAADPFGVFGAPQPAALPPSQPAPPGGPFAAGPPGAEHRGSALGGPPPVHPGFPGQPAPVPGVPPQQAPPAPQPQPPAPQPAADDPWNDMFGAPQGSASASSGVAPQPAPSGPVPGEDDDLFGAGLQPTRDEERGARPSHSQQEAKQPPKKGKSKRRKDDALPPGEYYDAKIFTPTLGVMFFKPKELVDSLFLNTPMGLVDALDERPVVAFIVEGSSARSAGVELGHVLLKVNGIDVRNPKEASRLIKEGPRPLPLLFYIPETTVTVAEGEHMVKYNTKDTGAPNSAKDWKPKYVVIGGIIAQPYMMNMYRSKSEYDIAVIETQARRPVSVKVKQFSLQGARIQNDWQGPQMVKYKNKMHPWKYIVVLPISRNPIKIASPNATQLKPVREGIQRLLQSQQKHRMGGGGPSHGRDSYRGEDRHDDRRNGGPSSPGAYYGGRGASGQGSGGGYDTRGNYHGRPPAGDDEHNEQRRPAQEGAFYGGRTQEDRMGMGNY